MIRFLFTLLLGLSITSVLGQVRPYPMDSSSLLWKIHATDSTEESFLFGTVHLISQNEFFFPYELTETIKSCDSIVLELLLDNNGTELTELLLLADEDITDYFNPLQLDSVITWFETQTFVDSALFMSMCRKIKPVGIWGIAIAFANNPSDTADGNAGKTEKFESYEVRIKELADSLKINVGAVETAEFQMSLFDGLPKEAQTEMVMAHIRDTGDEDTTHTTMEDLFDAYNRQNVDELHVLVSGDDQLFGDQLVDFIDIRNENWIPKIIRAMGQERTFFAFGAGHLGGPNGIIRLLEAQGFQLSPVKL